MLVALYRAGKFLEHKLKSLEQQTLFEQCQIVLLNCQNLNNERALYCNFASKHDNVKVIEYDRYTKLYPTWNDGIRQTESEYIMNSNVDDQLHPNCIAMLAAALDTASEEYGIATSDSYISSTPNQVWPNWQWEGRINAHYPGSTLGPCPMWRRSLHDRFGYFEDKYVVGDALMWHKWYRAKVKFIKVPGPLSLYYKGNNLETRRDEKGRSLRDLDMQTIKPKVRCCRSSKR